MEFLEDLLNRVFLWLLNSKRLHCHRCGTKIKPHSEYERYGKTIEIFSIFDIGSLGVFCEVCIYREYTRFRNRYGVKVKGLKPEPKIDPEKGFFGDSEPSSHSMSLKEYASFEGQKKWAGWKRQREEREKNC